MQIKKSKPKVGQTLFRLELGRNKKSSGLIKVIVAKVGTKFFYCKTEDSPATRQYKIDTWYETYTHGTSDSFLYESEQAWEDEKEINSICKLLYDSFEYGNNKPETPLENLSKSKELLYFKECGSTRKCQGEPYAICGPECKSYVIPKSSK